MHLRNPIHASFHSPTLPCAPNQFPQDDNATKKVSAPNVPILHSNALLGVVLDDPKTSLSATGFLQTMFLLNDQDLAKFGEFGKNKDLMAWKKLLIGRNLQVALAELSIVGVDEVLDIYPGLSVNISEAHGKCSLFNMLGPRAMSCKWRGWCV